MAEHIDDAELGTLLLGLLESLPAGAEVSFRRISATPNMHKVTLSLPGERVRAFTGQAPGELLLAAAQQLARVAGG